LFRSYNLLAWLIVFLLINHIYFVLVEEPGLAKRFGEEYEIYKQNVPRWLPRLTPWERKD
jgi:protein-S-isoprenylcysteine O-methyltransferase Ste14